MKIYEDINFKVTYPNPLTTSTHTNPAFLHLHIHLQECRRVSSKTLESRRGIILHYELRHPGLTIERPRLPLLIVVDVDAIIRDVVHR